MWTNKMICCCVTWAISNELPATLAVDLDMTFRSCHCVHAHTMPCAWQTDVTEAELLELASDSAAVVGSLEFYPVLWSGFFLSGKRISRQTNPV